MSLINPISFQVANQIVPNNRFPLCEINSREPAYGNIYMSSGVGITAVQGHVWDNIPPNTGFPQYLRTGSDLLLEYPGCLEMAIVGSSEIAWIFYPVDIGAITGDFFSLEFNITCNINTLAQLIVKIVDQIQG